MNVEYSFKSADDELRAKSLIDALFESERMDIKKFNGNTTVVLSDAEPAFYISNFEKIKMGNNGWRNAAKDIGLTFLNRLVDVRKVADLAEYNYNRAIEQSKLIKILKKDNDER